MKLSANQGRNKRKRREVPVELILQCRGRVEAEAMQALRLPAPGREIPEYDPELHDAWQRRQAAARTPSRGVRVIDMV